MSIIRTNVFGVLLMSAAAWAQTAQINGIIRDSSGLAIPGAAIKATQTATGVVRTTVSSDNGNYALSNLAVRLGGAGAADVAKIKAPLMLHYAGLDERINAGWPAYEAALKANGVKYQAFVYPNTNHGFNNDTTPRYDEAAAKLAWSRTIAFLNETLRT
jgi:acetyl esterase/lipase